MIQIQLKLLYVNDKKLVQFSNATSLQENVIVQPDDSGHADIIIIQKKAFYECKKIIYAMPNITSSYMKHYIWYTLFLFADKHRDRRKGLNSLIDGTI